jgi:hypothetical protein
LCVEKNQYGSEGIKVFLCCFIHYNVLI